MRGFHSEKSIRGGLLFFRLASLDKNPDRYDNLGFGNISQRLDSQSNQFIISGSQTGDIEHLSPEHYCLVVKAEPRKNRNSISGLNQAFF